mmetsp:Transcript_22199/g.49218  ORF Transcript_22199/g.49218 Transcript_22199/m.49218 type:complete len:406 (-) Transcript_22199:424-1641(-)
MHMRMHAIRTNPANVAASSTGSHLEAGLGQSTPPLRFFSFRFVSSRSWLAAQRESLGQVPKGGATGRLRRFFALGQEFLPRVVRAATAVSRRGSGSRRRPRRRPEQLPDQDPKGTDFDGFHEPTEFVVVVCRVVLVVPIPIGGTEIAHLDGSIGVVVVVGVGVVVGAAVRSPWLPLPLLPDQYVVGVEIGVGNPQGVELGQDPKRVDHDLPQREILQGFQGGFVVDVPRTAFHARRSRHRPVVLQKFHDEGTLFLGFSQQLDEGRVAAPAVVVVGEDQHLGNGLLVPGRPVRGELPGKGLDGDLPSLPGGFSGHATGSLSEDRPGLVVQNRVVEDREESLFFLAVAVVVVVVVAVATAEDVFQKRVAREGNPLQVRARPQEIHRRLLLGQLVASQPHQFEAREVL